MTINLTLKASWFKPLGRLWRLFTPEQWIALLSAVLAVAATTWSYSQGYIVAYGDAESHLNISKRVVHSLTPGFAQLGGIWLPLPHLLMLPFVYFDPLWRTGLAGSIVSGAAFVVSAVYLYKLAFLVAESRAAGLVAALVFVTNPNVLYLATTPMTELLLIVFFVLSTYHFVRYLKDREDILALILAAFFGFCAVLSRYDAWFLVAFEALALLLAHAPWQKVPKKLSELLSLWHRPSWERLQGRLVLFGILAFFGIFLWLGWDYLILGDPLYFTNSEFSAKSQQMAWEARGQLPAKHNLPLSLLYYLVTTMSNVGVLVFLAMLAGLAYYLGNPQDKNRLSISLVLSVPFIFNVVSLFLGQSVIFIPHVTPVGYDWRLFNVRYGVMMAPFAAFYVGYLFSRSRAAGRALIACLLVLQVGLYLVGYSKVTSFEDGVRGLSSAVAKLPDAQFWIQRNYDGGLVLTDDFARTISIVRSGIPMEQVIYVGTKPYWEESLEAPEKYATWIVMQENDEVWKNIWERPDVQGRLYKYFVKVYTSPQILIFKRNPNVRAEN